jgi:hypothetical protein
LKIVGECFPWSSSSTFTYTLSNHKSVLGIGAYAQQAKAQLHALSKDGVTEWLKRPMEATASNSNSSDGSTGCGSLQSMHLALEDTGSVSSVSKDDSSMSQALTTYSSSSGDDLGVTHHLLAFPAKCNYEGVLHPLDWIQQVHG